jgi:hypothetical protein
MHNQKINMDKLKRRSYRHATLTCQLFWRYAYFSTLQKRKEAKMKNNVSFHALIGFLLFLATHASSPVLAQEHLQSLNIDINKTIGEISPIYPDLQFLKGRNCGQVEDFRQYVTIQLTNKIENNRYKINSIKSRIYNEKCKLELVDELLSLYDISGRENVIDSAFLIIGNINANIALTTFLICASSGATCLPSFIIYCISIGDFINDAKSMSDKNEKITFIKNKRYFLYNEIKSLQDQLELNSSLEYIYFQDSTHTFTKTMIQNIFKIENNHCLKTDTAPPSIPRTFSGNE